MPPRAIPGNHMTYINDFAARHGTVSVCNRLPATVDLASCSPARRSTSNGTKSRSLLWLNRA